MSRDLDVITIGRSSVDLYGAQVGGRLEDMASFNKYIGGSPTNMAVGAARLGLRAGLITRVGDEHMGRFVREELAREGVDTTGIATDPERLTALVILGIRDQSQFPLIFYRENCADMALDEADIDPAFIARAHAVVATGTHLSHPRTEAAVLKAIRLAREGGARTALDIDYRPNLWGLSGHGDGENRFIASERVTEKLKATLPLFDLIVGTEEEFHIAGGSTDTLAALNAVRAVTRATLVCKRGPMGAVAFTGAIGDTLDAGVSGPGFPVEVFNVLGAGDGFMAGLLRGWIRSESWRASLTYANACGAFAVSRHGCAPAYPSWHELQHFLETGVTTPALREDAALEQLHWSTTRRPMADTLRLLAFGDGAPFASLPGATAERIGAFKRLCVDAARDVGRGGDGHGVVCDGWTGRDALHAAAGTPLAIVRPALPPGTPPQDVAAMLGPDCGDLAEWPLVHTVGIVASGAAAEAEAVRRLFHAARRNRLEVLLTVAPDAPDDEAVIEAVERVASLGLYPDWWGVPPLASAAGWQATCGTIARHDPHTRGVIVVAGKGRPPEDAFALAGQYPLVRGFATGPDVIAAPARRFMVGATTPEAAREEIAAAFATVCRRWEEARAGVAEAAG